MIERPYQEPRIGVVLPAAVAVAPLGNNPVLVNVRDLCADCCEFLLQHGAVATPLPRFQNCWVIYPASQPQAPILLQAGDRMPILIVTTIETPARSQLISKIREFMTLHGYPIQIQSKLSGLR
ncbi:MAG: hypothetical protein HC925_00055 [Coleofasciculaceae cyanobacterium SM2_3_26]|nr:hypothetical protein [Coleofasciculaceae cyanobacterium SM2_3_26]